MAQTEASTDSLGEYLKYIENALKDSSELREMFKQLHFQDNEQVQVSGEFFKAAKFKVEKVFISSYKALENFEVFIDWHQN